MQTFQINILILGIY